MRSAPQRRTAFRRGQLSSSSSSLSSSSPPRTLICPRISPEAVPRRMHVRVRHARAHRREHLRELPGRDSLSGGTDHVRSGSTVRLAPPERGPPHDRRTRGPGVGGRPAQPDGDPAIDALLADVDVGLGDVAFQVLESERVLERVPSWLIVARNVPRSRAGDRRRFFDPAEVRLQLPRTVCLRDVLLSRDRQQDGNSRERSDTCALHPVSSLVGRFAGRLILQSRCPYMRESDRDQSAVAKSVLRAARSRRERRLTLTVTAYACCARALRQATARAWSKFTSRSAGLGGAAQHPPALTKNAASGRSAAGADLRCS